MYNVECYSKSQIVYGPLNINSVIAISFTELV